MFMKIRDVLKRKVKTGGEGVKYAIYPFGQAGKMVKNVLNNHMGIVEALICDNKLSHTDSEIYSISEVTDLNEYVWIVAVVNVDKRKEVLESLQGVEKEKIIDVYASEYTEGYKLLSQIGQGVNSAACREIIELVEKKKNEKRKIVVGEIGVDIGATSVEICKRLDENDVFCCFDFQSIVDDLVSDLERVPDIKCKLVGKGNSSKVYDSYCWNLSEMLFEMRNDGKDGIFDIVYLDAVHDFARDGLAVCLLKQMVKPGGYIVLDDMKWTFGTNPGYNPRTVPIINDWYTEEQIYDCQVQRVANAFLIEDKDFRQIYLSNSLNPERAVFERLV